MVKAFMESNLLFMNELGSYELFLEGSIEGAVELPRNLMDSP